MLRVPYLDPKSATIRADQSLNLTNEWALLRLNWGQVPVKVLDVSKNIGGMTFDSIVEKWIKNWSTHLDLCLLEGIEELDHIALLLLVKDWLQEWLKREKRLKDQVNLFEAY